MGTLSVSHEGHIPYKSAVKWNYRIPVLLYICPNSAPQQPLFYPKVTFPRVRLELKSYLEACALYTVASFLGPQFLFSLAGCIHQEKASKLSQESMPKILWKKAAFLCLNTCSSSSNMGSLNGKKPLRAPSFLHSTCCERKSNITSRKAYLTGGAFKSSGDKAWICRWRGKSSQSLWKQCKSK